MWAVAALGLDLDSFEVEMAKLLGLEAYTAAVLNLVGFEQVVVSL